jgi:Transposase
VQRLVADGETVVDVPAKLSARARLFDTAQARKTDPADAHCVAVAALRANGLRLVVVDDTAVALKLLVDRRDGLGRARTEAVSRLHHLLLELVPGGAKQFLSAPQARALLNTVRPRRIVGRTRRQLASELITEIDVIDKKIKAANARLTELAVLTGRPITTLTRALTALRPLVTADHPAKIHGPSTGDTLIAACRHRMASKGIHGIVIQRAANHDHVCLRHRRWLHGPEQHPLEALPEVEAANRRHRRLVLRHDAATLDIAFTNAQQLIHDKFRASDQTHLHCRWTNRLNLLRHDPHADPYRPDRHRIELVTYPETVILTTLLASKDRASDLEPHYRVETSPQRDGRP